jgi:hypothetical protein
VSDLEGVMGLGESLQVLRDGGAQACIYGIIRNDPRYPAPLPLCPMFRLQDHQVSE